MELTERQAETSRFFHSLLQGVMVEGLYLLLWTLPDKKSEWVPATDIEAAAQVVQRRADQDIDVYCGVALAGRNHGATARCKSDQTAGIFGLWADVDIADQAHKKKNLPPTIEDATELLNSCGLVPSIVVHSGHGLQAWWLFKEAWIFEDDQQRQSAAALSQRWNNQLRRKAKEKGWDVDATHDLARVLRVPGTENRKGEVVPVRLVSVVDASYTSEDFDSILPSGADLASVAAETVRVGAITLDPNAQPPLDKFLALQTNDKNFKKSVERQRQDISDQSPSSYDMSLATIAAAAAWSDQEIVNLLIFARRQAGDDLKLRLDYYRRTVEKAKRAAHKTQSWEYLEEVVDQANEENISTPAPLPSSGSENEPPPPEPKAKPAEPLKSASILDAVSHQLGIKLTRVIKMRASKPLYHLSTPDGGMLLGEVDQLIDQAMFRRNIAAMFGVYLEPMKQPKWGKIAAALLLACEEQEIGDDAEHSLAGVGWIRDYLEDNPIEQDKKEAVAEKAPFYEDGGKTVCFFQDRLRSWLFAHKGEKFNPKHLGAILRMSGATPKTIYAKVMNKDTSRSVWCIDTKKVI